MAEVSSAVRAAGGLVLRVTPKGRIKVLVVHRPRYDDWGLPKGKLDPGETDEEAAVREVLEETGYRCRIVAPLPETAHETKRGPKTVAWYAMRPLPDSPGFVPNEEIDEVRWLSPKRASATVDYDNDRRLIASANLEKLARTGAVWVIRHGVAMDKGSWKGDDNRRPLDARGLKQADRLAEILSDQGIDLVITSPAKRCRTTIAPIAKKVKASVIRDRRLTRNASRSDVASLLDRVTGHQAVICTHGETIPLILAEAARRGAKVNPSAETAKGSAWKFEVRNGKFRLAGRVDP